MSGRYKNLREFIFLSRKTFANIRNLNKRIGLAKYFMIPLGIAGIYFSSPLLGDEKKASESPKSPPILNPKKFLPFELEKIEKINHNTKKFVFRLPNEEESLNLPVASCVVVRAPLDAELVDDDGKRIVRPYTPISGILENEKGSFALAVKKYRKGTMSRYIHDMEIGDVLEVKGPIYKIPYEPNMKKEIGMIAGGTGITPMMQILSKITSNPEDKTKVHLIFANIADRDILFKDYFDKLAQEHPQVKVHYVLEKPPNDWDGSVGYVNHEIIKKHIPPPSDDVLVMVCGPPPMLKAISGPKAPDYTQGEIGGILKDLGYRESQVYKF